MRIHVATVNSWSPQHRDLLGNLCWTPGVKWDSLRCFVEEKGIPFLGLCKLRGKRVGGLEWM